MNQQTQAIRQGWSLQGAGAVSQIERRTRSDWDAFTLRETELITYDEYLSERATNNNLFDTRNRATCYNTLNSAPKKGEQE